MTQYCLQEKESFLPEWSLGVIKEVEPSSDLEVRIVIIKYTGEIIKKVDEKPQIKSGEIGLEIYMRITRRDSRSLIKLSVIDVDIENDLKICLFGMKITSSPNMRQ